MSAIGVLELVGNTSGQLKMSKLVVILASTSTIGESPNVSGLHVYLPSLVSTNVETEVQTSLAGEEVAVVVPVAIVLVTPAETEYSLNINEARLTGVILNKVNEVHTQQTTEVRSVKSLVSVGRIASRTEVVVLCIDSSIELGSKTEDGSDFLSNGQANNRTKVAKELVAISASYTTSLYTNRPVVSKLAATNSCLCVCENHACTNGKKHKNFLHVFKCFCLNLPREGASSGLIIN